MDLDPDTKRAMFKYYKSIYKDYTPYGTAGNLKFRFKDELADISKENLEKRIAKANSITWFGKPGKETGTDIDGEAASNWLDDMSSKYGIK